MTPSKILTTYYLATFSFGVVLTLLVTHFVDVNELGTRGAGGLIFCWNVLFIMLLPLVLDWAERRYLKARFLALEEVAKSNPELAEILKVQCQKLSIADLKLAIVDTKSDELFSYGLWGSNPRLMVPGNLLNPENETKIIPSIEAELTRISRRDHTVIFFMFAACQVGLFVVLLSMIS
ncbi:MAG: hypothetical protein K8F91_12590 [Candidatus Obscuribacterales bacterium]|nr:hypothetical protein [Candidatus Obscuribacterales bacterium]